MRIGIQRLVPSRELRKPLSLPAIHRTVHRYPVLRRGWEEEERGGGERKRGGRHLQGGEGTGKQLEETARTDADKDVSHLQARPSGDTCKGAA